MGRDDQNRGVTIAWIFAKITQCILPHALGWHTSIPDGDFKIEQDVSKRVLFKHLLGVCLRPNGSAFMPKRLKPFFEMLADFRIVVDD
jgi:hypothetical protein